MCSSGVKDGGSICGGSASGQRLFRLSEFHVAPTPIGVRVRRHQAIVGIDPVELAFRQDGLIAQPLHLLRFSAIKRRGGLPAGSLGLLPSLQLCRRHRIEEGGGDPLIDRSCRQMLADRGVLRIVQRVANVTDAAFVLHRDLVSARAAPGDTLQQGVPLRGMPRLVLRLYSA